MVNPRMKRKYVHSSLALLVLAIPFNNVRGEPPRAVSTQDPPLTFLGLLPRSPVSAPGEKDKRGLGHVGRQTTAEIPATQSNGRQTPDNGQSFIGYGYDEAASTEDPPPTFLGLLPRPPLASAIGNRSRKATTIGNPYYGQRTADDGRGAVDNPFDGQRATESGQSPSGDGYKGIQEAELLFPSLLSRSPVSPPFLATPGEGGEREGWDEEPALTGVASRRGFAPLATMAWNWVSQALTTLDGQFRLPSPWPRSSAVTQRVEGKRGNGETAAAQQNPIEPPHAGYDGQRPVPADTRETADNGQRPIDYGQSAIGNGYDAARADISDANRTPKPESRAPSRFGVGLRDPFKLPPPPRPAREEIETKVARNRPPGPRGLLIAQLTLKGVARDSATNKMIAVVTNKSNRAYFLREGDAVYDGVVANITPDAVYFKENVPDGQRAMHFRQIVKTMNPATGEVQ